MARKTSEKSVMDSSELLQGSQEEHYTAPASGGEEPTGEMDTQSPTQETTVDTAAQDSPEPPSEVLDAQDTSEQPPEGIGTQNAPEPSPEGEDGQDAPEPPVEAEQRLNHDAERTAAQETQAEDADTPKPLEPIAAKPPVRSKAAAKTAAKTAKPKAAKTAKDGKDKSDVGSARRAFYSLDFRALDRDLSPEQEQEWNSIYASFRSGSILTGTVVGVDEHTFDITDENGKTERRTVQSLVIIGYRVKVVIPETEIWAVGEENSRYATRSMVGAKIDYVIMNVDRAGDCAIASRRMAMVKKRRHFPSTVRNNRELVKCDVILVAQKVLLANVGGFDLILTQRDLSYTSIADLRTEYKPGQELSARLLDIKDGKPVVSVKEVNPNPFDGAELRHPVGCRRQAVIEGKYGGGVFCRLPDDTTCLCLYSNNHFDTEFLSGDSVLIYITEFDNNRKLVYGRIVAKR